MTVKCKCSGKTWSDIGHSRIYRCSRNATVERDGAWWCWQHDPEYVKGNKEKRLADWRAKSAREVAKYARLARNARLANLVTLELAMLLERLANYTDFAHPDTCNQDDCDCTSRTGVQQCGEDGRGARKLAARIREALEETE